MRGTPNPSEDFANSEVKKRELNYFVAKPAHREAG